MTLDVAAAPDRPWEPERARTCLRGRVLVKVASGEAPRGIPHYLDVKRGRAAPSIRLDGGPVDRVLRRFSPAVQVTSAFQAAVRFAASGDRGGARWDDLEERLGLSRTFRVDLDPDASLLGVTEELAALGVVETVTPLYVCNTPFAEAAAPEPPGDPLYAHRMVGASEALSFEPGDSALVVAVVDSGVAVEHGELAGRTRPGVDTVDLPADRTSRALRLVGDTTGPDRIPRDEMGHGTACASIIAARGRGVPCGVGGDARVLPARALAAARHLERTALTAIGAVPDIDQAVKLAVDLGAKVLNLSFGTPETALRPNDPRPHAEVVEYALARGCILVAASGNSGTAIRYYPAAHPGVIAVGSVDPRGCPSTFSTRGDHVALSAPGERIPVAALAGYTRQTGTSFAAPFVAGACALLVARAARYGVPLDAHAARTILARTARPFGAGAEPQGSGDGVLDIPAALRALERALSARAGAGSHDSTPGDAVRARLDSPAAPP